MSGTLRDKYRQNDSQGKAYVAKTAADELSRRNERLFLRLQEIHNVSNAPNLIMPRDALTRFVVQKKVKQGDRTRTPVQYQGFTTISSPMVPGTLNFPARKQEAARIDNENYRFAQRIIN